QPPDRQPLVHITIVAVSTREQRRPTTRMLLIVLGALKAFHGGRGSRRPGILSADTTQEDLADTDIHADADIHEDIADQYLAELVVISHAPGCKKRASAAVGSS
ncbi:MAG: hypothetical protein QOE30_5317, partial [Mycobacterium sp.]|nr:hypothetical protein [Mycobacterium sp.]